MDVNTAMIAVLTTASYVRKAPFDGSPCPQPADFPTVQPCLAADVWNTVVASVDRIYIKETNMRRVALALTHTIHALLRVVFVPRDVLIAATGPEAPNTAPMWLADVLWPLAALVHTLADRVSLQADAAASMGTELPPVLVAQPQVYQNGVPVTGAITAGTDTGTVTRIITRFEEAAASAGAACRLYALAPESVLTGLRKGCDGCPVLALVEACVATLALAARSQSYAKKSTGTLLGDERPAAFRFASDPHSTLLEVLLATYSRCQPDVSEVTHAQSSRVRFLITSVMEHALFTDSFASSLFGGCSRSLQLAQHGALYVLHSAQSAAGRTAATADSMHEVVLNGAAWPRVADHAALQRIAIVSGDRAVFDILSAARARTVGKKGILRALPLLCGMFLAAEARTDEAEQDVAPAAKTPTGPAAASTTGASPVHPIAVAALSQLNRRRRFAVVMEFVCVALGYAPGGADKAADNVIVDTTVVEPHFSLLSCDADMLLCIASLLTFACDNSVYNIHEDVAPHAQYCSLKLCADAVLHTAERMCTEVHDPTSARSCADAIARVSISLLKLHTALLPDLHRVLHLTAVMGARGEDGGAAVTQVAMQCVDSFSRLRRLGVYIRAAGEAWSLLRDGLVAKVAGQYFQACMTDSEHVAAYSSALRTLPPGQVQSHGDMLVGIMLQRLDACEACEDPSDAPARAGQKRSRSVAVAPNVVAPHVTAVQTWTSMLCTYLRCLWLSPAAAVPVLRRAVQVAHVAGARLVSLATGDGSDDTDGVVRLRRVYATCACSLLTACMDATVSAAPFQDVRSLVDIHSSKEKQAMSPLWPMSVCTAAIGDVELPVRDDLDRKAWMRTLQDVASVSDDANTVVTFAAAHVRLLIACFGRELPEKLSKHGQKLHAIIDASAASAAAEAVVNTDLLDKPVALEKLLQHVCTALHESVSSFIGAAVGGDAATTSSGKKRARSQAAVSRLPEVVLTAFTNESHEDDEPKVYWEECQQIFDSCALYIGSVTDEPAAKRVDALIRDIDAHLARVPQDVWDVLHSPLCSATCARACFRLACECMRVYALVSVHAQRSLPLLERLLVGACMSLDRDSAAAVPTGFCMLVATQTHTTGEHSTPSPLLAAALRFLCLAASGAAFVVNDVHKQFGTSGAVCASVFDALATLPEPCQGVTHMLKLLHEHTDSMMSSPVVAASALRAVCMCPCDDSHGRDATNGIAHTLRKHIRSTVKHGAAAWDAVQMHVLACIAGACAACEGRSMPYALSHTLAHAQLYEYTLMCVKAAAATDDGARVAQCIESIAPCMHASSLASAAALETYHPHTRAILSGVASHVYSHALSTAAEPAEADDDTPLTSCSLPQLRRCLRAYSERVTQESCATALSHTLQAADAADVIHTLREVISHPRAWDLPTHLIRDVTHIACSHVRWAPLTSAALNLLSACVKYHRDALMDVLPAVVHAITSTTCDCITTSPLPDASLRVGALVTTAQAVAAMCRPVRYNAVAVLTTVCVHITRLLSRGDAHVRAVRASMDACKPAIYAWLELCSQREMQEIHTRVETGTARAILKELHTAYEAEFKYTGKA